MAMDIKHDYKWLEENGCKLYREQTDLLLEQWDSFVEFMERNFYKPGTHVFPIESKSKKKHITHLTFKAQPRYKNKNASKVDFYLIKIGIYFTNEWELADSTECQMSIGTENLKSMLDEDYLFQYRGSLVSNKNWTS